MNLVESGAVFWPLKRLNTNMHSGSMELTRCIRSGDHMEDDQKTKKPVIDWHQVYICNGFDMLSFDTISSDFSKNEHKIDEP